MNQELKPTGPDSLNALARFFKTLRLVWRLHADPRVPRWTKLIIPATIVYVLSPIDLIPDFILGLGQVDDIAILFMSVSLFLQVCPAEIVAEHRRALGEPLPEHDDGEDQVVEGSFHVVDGHDSTAKR